MKKWHIQLAITLVAVVLLVVHMFMPDARVDSISVALLALAAIPWLGMLFTSLEIPGVGKFNYTEIERQVKEANDDLKEIITSDDSDSEKIKDSQKVVDELFKLGYQAGGGKSDVSNVYITRDAEGSIIGVQYEER